MCFVGVPTDNMKDMYTLSPNTVQASLTAYKSIMAAGTTGAVAAGTDYSWCWSRRGQAHAERHGYGCCHGGQALVEPTFV